MWALSLLIEWAHTKTEKNSDQGGNWTHDLRIRSPPLYRLSYKVRREQIVGTEVVIVTAMNMYKYKEGLRFFANFGRVALIFEQTY